MLHSSESTDVTALALGPQEYIFYVVVTSATKALATKRKYVKSKGIKNTI